jgi:hypothetical protein
VLSKNVARVLNDSVILTSGLLHRGAICSVKDGLGSRNISPHTQKADYLPPSRITCPEYAKTDLPPNSYQNAGLNIGCSARLAANLACLVSTNGIRGGNSGESSESGIRSARELTSTSCAYSSKEMSWVNAFPESIIEKIDRRAQMQTTWSLMSAPWGIAILYQGVQANKDGSAHTVKMQIMRDFPKQD